MKSWILVGMMGAGKSSVGRRLAELTEREFLDTDQLVQYKLGRPIWNIFSTYGEEAFRDYETNALKHLEPGSAVLATGGGIVLKDENWVELNRLGTTLFLDVPVDVLIDRLEISSKKRPLLEHEDWKDRVRRILADRRPFYERADFTYVVKDSDVGTIAREVSELLAAGLETK